MFIPINLIRTFVILLNIWWCGSPDQNDPFVGKWERLPQVAASSFEIAIERKGRDLKGTHCAVQKGGEKIDCVHNEYSMTGVDFGREAVFKITSAFSQTKGRAKLTLLNKDSLEWKLIVAPPGEHYLPVKCMMVRKYTR